MIWPDKVFDQANFFQGGQRKIRHVELPPAVAVLGRTGIGVVVVVPALAVCQQCEQPIVGAVFSCVVVLVAHMCAAELIAQVTCQV